MLESELKKAEDRQAQLLREYNNGEPEKQGSEGRNYQKYLDRVSEMKAELARNESDIAGIRREITRLPAPKPDGLRQTSAGRQALPGLRPALDAGGRHQDRWHLALRNASLEDALGTSRRTLEGSAFGSFFHEPQALATAVAGARSNDFATLRYEAVLRRPASSRCMCW